MKTRPELWKDKPEAHDYPAARDYLTLVLDGKRAGALVARLQKAPLIRRKAKDILRASGLPVLPKDNPHVARDLKKVRKGEALSPVLLLRGDLRRGLPLVIADGYHRICASWHSDENALIPCRMVPGP
jgi:hypothetical protein